MKIRFPSYRRATLPCLLLSLSFYLTSCMDFANNDIRHKKIVQQNIHFKPGQVYTMRGLGGVFSTGMNRLEDSLIFYHHIQTSSTIWYKAYSLAQFIIEKNRSGEFKGPIILIGHSLGANDQIKVAKFLQKAHIPVRLIITIDAVSPIHVPNNVAEVLNIYKPGYVPMFTGKALIAEDPAATKIENLNVKTANRYHVNHFTIDKNQQIQQLMIEKVVHVINHV